MSIVIVSVHIIAHLWPFYDVLVTFDTVYIYISHVPFTSVMLVLLIVNNPHTLDS